MQHVFVCQSCGGIQPKWTGRCEACGAWNSLVEETSVAPAGGKAARRRGALELVDLGGEGSPLQRTATGLPELDRVLGGGLVPGSPPISKIGRAHV